MNSMNRYLSLDNSEKIIVFCIAQKNKLWLHNEKTESLIGASVVRVTICHYSRHGGVSDTRYILPSI